MDSRITDLPGMGTPSLRAYITGFEIQRAANGYMVRGPYSFQMQGPTNRPAEWYVFPTIDALFDWMREWAKEAQPRVDPDADPSGFTKL